jgi:hypothetical protein
LHIWHTGTKREKIIWGLAFMAGYHRNENMSNQPTYMTMDSLMRFACFGGYGVVEGKRC